MKYPITNKYGETVEPSGHIRERIGASICAAKPSMFSKKEHYDSRLGDPIRFFLFTFNEKSRGFFESEWADNLLVALDRVGLKIVEIDEEFGT